MEKPTITDVRELISKLYEALDCVREQGRRESCKALLAQINVRLSSYDRQPIAADPEGFKGQ